MIPQVGQRFLWKVNKSITVAEILEICSKYYYRVKIVQVINAYYGLADTVGHTSFATFDSKSFIYLPGQDKPVC